MLMRDLPYDPFLEPRADSQRARSAMATLLRAASRSLEAVASSLTLRPPKAVCSDPLLEFHGEAGAPEGALYVNGQLVGHVLGVNRL